MTQSANKAQRRPTIAECIRDRYVMPGWSQSGWAARLRQLAERCATIQPGLAAAYREWAHRLEEAA